MGCNIESGLFTFLLTEQMIKDEEADPTFGIYQIDL